MRFLLLMLLSVFAFADEPKSPEPAKPPVIPLDLQTDYFAANAEMAAISARIALTCGEKYTPQQRGNRIACVAKPEPPKSEPPIKEK